jgi:hypothetical protein
MWAYLWIFYGRNMCKLNGSPLLLLPPFGFSRSLAEPETWPKADVARPVALFFFIKMINQLHN